MSASRISIKEFLSHSQNKLVIDVRSPGEYSHAHLPGSVNIPLFNDEERKVVGTAYKQQSRELAIKIGLDFFGPKMRGIVEEVERLSKNKDSVTINHQVSTVNSVFIFCWRGGMRSAAISWLLGLYGFNVTVLTGGYKAYRNYVLQTLSLPWSLNVVGGYTGSGKTEVLHKLESKGARVIDLEHLASHKGSAFGSIGMLAQPSQEMFENLLALHLSKQNGEPIWIEDESQRIGLVNIPAPFWKTIRNAPVCFIDIPFEERLDHITEEYGALDKEALAAAIQRISKRLGGLETKNALGHLQEATFKECFRILLTYYDKHYLKGLHNREALPALLTKFSFNTVSPSNADLLLKHQPA